MRLGNTRIQQVWDQNECGFIIFIVYSYVPRDRIETKWARNHLTSFFARTLNTYAKAIHIFKRSNIRAICVRGIEIKNCKILEIAKAKSYFFKK